MDAQRRFETEWQNKLGYQGFLYCLCRKIHTSAGDDVKQSYKALQWIFVPPEGTKTRGLIPRGCQWLRLFARVYSDTLQLFEAHHPVALRRAANLHSYLEPPRPLATVCSHNTCIQQNTQISHFSIHTQQHLTLQHCY